MKIDDIATGTKFDTAEIAKYEELKRTNFAGGYVRAFITRDGRRGVACYHFSDEELEASMEGEELPLSANHIDFVDTDYDEDANEKNFFN